METKSEASASGKRRKSKTQTRIKLINSIEKRATNKHAIESINYKSFDEARIKQSLQTQLVLGVQEFYEFLGHSKIDSEKAAYEEVLWEGTPHQTIRHKTFLGCNHRPDFQILTQGLDIAVEVKIGNNGSSLRAGLGQAMVYSQLYDFTIYIFVDKSPNNDIKKSIPKEIHQRFIEGLWNDQNIKFIII